MKESRASFIANFEFTTKFAIAKLARRRVAFFVRLA